MSVGPASTPGRSTRTVTELTRDIKLSLERGFYNLWVEGEISNLKQPASGHYYFTLKDDQSQIAAVLFRGSTRHLRFRPQDGMAVLVWGHVTVYEPKGTYQIRVERMDPLGKGSLTLAFEQLKEKLEREGLFDPKRKRPLPLLPQRIGIVTSPTGAALRDIARTLARRFPNLEVVVYPAQVQGELAAAEIAKGVQVLNRLGAFDVLIVTRGGGSLEDLWPFNEESVARAIASSRIPVMSAVGHEVDYTIADFVADVRAPTPSAAAEMVVKSKDEFLARLRSLESHRAFSAVRHAIEMRGQRVDDALSRARRQLEQRTFRLRHRLQALVRRLEAERVDRRLGVARARLERLLSQLQSIERNAVHRKRRVFAEASSKLEALSPLAVLGRGYSLAWSPQGKLLRSSDEVSVGDPIRVDLGRGRLRCRVEERDDSKGP